MSKTVKIYPSAKEQHPELIDFFDEIRKGANDFEIIKESGLNSVLVAILINSVPIGNSSPTIEYNCSKLFIVSNVNFKSTHVKVKDQQEVQQMILRGKIDRLLQGFKLNDNSNIKFISVVIAYNIDEDTLKLKTNNDNQENIIPYRILKPKYNLDSIVLSAQLTEEIYQALSLIKNFEIIYDSWGFREIDPNMRLIINFFGPSGTGKTMTAHGIANNMGKMLMSLNYSEIESKYVGDAPKNLMRAFEEAKENDAVLFFDEADSFLGKRITNITHSSDQAVNSLRSQMLILLDNFDGVVIFATNLVENYDKAFNSRILSHLHFQLPDFELRKRLILKIMPPRVKYQDNLPFTDAEISSLSSIAEGFSGREIKNAILNGLANALIKDRFFITFDDIESSFLNLKTVREKILKDEKKVEISPELKKSLEEKVKNHLQKD